MKHLRLIKRNIAVSPFLSEVERLEDYWDTRRAMKLPVQRETINIDLRMATPLGSVHVNDNHLHQRSPLYEHFPELIRFMEEFSREADGELSRAMVVSLRAGGKVYEHIDMGEYYSIRDRYHLVLQSEGSIMRSGDEERIFRTGELWWFDNKAPHSAENPSGAPRIHVIFDLLPRKNRAIVEEWTRARIGAT